MSDSIQRVRLDKWLWAARFYKTRSQSGSAIKGGKVDLNDARGKPSQHVRLGDRVEIRKGPYRWNVAVAMLSERRRGADVARTLYTESEDSERMREETRARISLERQGMPSYMAGQGRPTKKQRRSMMKFREQFASPEDVDDSSAANEPDWNWRGDDD